MLAASLVFLAVISVGKARAQFPYTQPSVNPYGRPTLNPYLNLLRGGNPAINYAGLVVPQQRFYNGFLQVNQQLAANQQQLYGLEGGMMPEVTGHTAYFMNTSHYFGNLQRRPQLQSGVPSAAGSRPSPPAGTGASQPRR
jgi:hypothetical protein